MKGDIHQLDQDASNTLNEQEFINFGKMVTDDELGEEKLKE